LVEEEKLRKRPSSSFGNTSVELPGGKNENSYRGPPTHPYEEEKIQKIKEKIQKIEKKPEPKKTPQNKTNSKINPKINIQNLLPTIAVILSLIAILLVLTISPIDKNELKGIASDLRAFDQKEFEVEIPINSNLYFNNAIPSNKLFKGIQTVPVYFEIPVSQVMHGKDIRTGIPLEVQINETIIVRGDILIDLSTSNISLELNEPASAQGTSLSKIKIKDIYGNEITSIANRIDKLAGD
jgi:hypothetical protein